jgi:uroporphyrinogen decarboxylase
MSAMGRFLRAVRGEALDVPPIWMMRQAGRYHRPYQALRAKHSFEELCRDPQLAAEVAMGPIDDFDFDAAILFSDLLFPLEALGFGLSYDDGPPKLDGSLDDDRVRRFRSAGDALDRLRFQGDAMRATRARLSPDKALIGFVGGPWTLFVYAVEGTHAGRLARAKASPDLYRAFADRLVPLLIENIRLQFEGGADVVMLFDTAAGELEADDFGARMAPDLLRLAAAWPGRLGYYAKGAEAGHFATLASGDWAGIGVDWRWDLAKTLSDRRPRGFVQGNFDPEALRAATPDFLAALERFLAPLRTLSPEARRGWICGLGHGVLPGTPEAHVRRFVADVREAFAS